MSSVPKYTAKVQAPGIPDPQTDHPHYPPPQLQPSEVAPPTRSDSIPQQASTQPGDGREVHYDSPIHGNPHPVGRTTDSGKVPFKERVIGVAKKTRGTLLGQPDVKEHGEQILRGEVTHYQEPKGVNDF